MASPSSSSTSPLSLADSLFQRSLDDLIKLLRAAPPSAEPSLLSSAASAVRREIRSPDPHTKSLALQKLTFLSSLHSLPFSFALFPALELLPSSSLPLKRAAYLFSSLFFHPSLTDLLPLATHQLRKDLASPNPYIASLALRFLASASCPDLARHLSADLLPLLASSRLPVRRSAVAAARSVLALHPDSVSTIFPKLVENLSDPSTVSAAVNVFCELSAADPQPYLPLAPDFYRILLDSSNNWVLIKVVKIFARLAPLEPRLAKRVVDPICDLMRRSPAKSLVFECVRAVAESFSEYDHAVRAAVDKIRTEFLSSDEDANLRYLGLLALSLLLARRQAWAVEENREAVIRSLMDLDPNIRREALHLVMGMVVGTNVVEITVLLINYALRSDPEFANEILETVLDACGKNSYDVVQDFDWYVSILGEMARNPHCEKGEEIGRQLVDIGLRVRDVRPELVRVARDLLIDPALLGNRFLDRILSAAAWVSGEYVELSKNPLELMEALLQPRTNLLPPLVRAVYIQAVFKVLIFCLNACVDEIETNDDCETDENSGVESEDAVGVSAFERPENKKHFTGESITHMLNLVESSVGPLSECDEVEVQERARNVIGLIHVLKEVRDRETDEQGFKKDSRTREIVKCIHAAFSEELGPVSVHAQQRVTVPDGLVLKENLADLDKILGDGGIVPTAPVSFSIRSHRHREIEEEESETASESTSLLAEHRKRHGLYYIPTEKDEAESNDYPRANDPSLPLSHGNAIEDLVKLAEQPLIPRKSKPVKPRPVVVKLDDGDGLPASLKPEKESKDDKLSGAIRDILIGNGGKSASSSRTSLEKSSPRRTKTAPTNDESISQSKENLVLADAVPESSSSRRSRHHKHGKERRRSPGKSHDKEENSHKNSSKSSHHHGKHKHRQRGDASLNVVPQAPIIQDFLL